MPFFLSPAFFLPPSHALVDYYREKGGMPLHDAVGVNGENGTTTENQGLAYGPSGVCWVIVRA